VLSASTHVTAAGITTARATAIIEADASSERSVRRREHEPTHMIDPAERARRRVLFMIERNDEADRRVVGEARASRQSRYFFFSPPILTTCGAAAITFGFSFFGFFASLLPRT
jgi:hypothetical protein